MRDSNMETAMDIAKNQGHHDVVKILRAHQNAKSFQHAKVTALKRWLADPMHRRLHEAWQASSAPHTNVSVDNFCSTWPLHTPSKPRILNSSTLTGNVTQWLHDAAQLLHQTGSPQRNVPDPCVPGHTQHLQRD